MNEQFELPANGLNWLAKKDGARVLARTFAIGGAICINDLGVWSIIGVVNYTCGSCKCVQSPTRVGLPT